MQCAPELAKLLGEEIEDPEKEFNSNRLDTPRGHEEEFTEAEELAKELTCVKKDRAELLHSLAHIKTNLIGSGGGEAQTAQILQLEKELELKKLTLNDLRAKGKKLTKSIADAGTQIHDAALLTPGGYEKEITMIKQLMSDITRLEEDLIEAEAKNRCAPTPTLENQSVITDQGTINFMPLQYHGRGSCCEEGSQPHVQIC